MNGVRLIDANALKDAIMQEVYKDRVGVFVAKRIFNLIDNAPTVDFEKLGKSLNCQIRAKYGSCDDCLLSCPRNELIKLLGLARPQGEWIYNKRRYQYVCSKCGEIPTKYTGCALSLKYLKKCYLYCPNCGAEMRGGESDANG